jgi:hypothetical protein
MAQADHEPDARIEEAARWLLDNKITGRGTVLAIRQRFGISAVEACHAISLEAKLRRGQA